MPTFTTPRSAELPVLQPTEYDRLPGEPATLDSLAALIGHTFTVDALPVRLAPLAPNTERDVVPMPGSTAPEQPTAHDYRENTWNEDKTGDKNTLPQRKAGDSGIEEKIEEQKGGNKSDETEDKTDDKK
jgi:hypothetical protein